MAEDIAIQYIARHILRAGSYKRLYHAPTIIFKGLSKIQAGKKTGRRMKFEMTSQ
jgi:hypothetical protein